MTKTIKKGLVACLIAMLAVLVGITASAWGVRAEEELTKQESDVKAAKNFVKYMKDFEEDDLGDDSWNDTPQNQKLWQNYYNAKNLIQQINTIQKEDLDGQKADEEANGEANNDLWTKLQSAKNKFGEVDKFFSDAYRYVAKILSNMYNIATKPDFSDEEYTYEARRAQVDELGKQLGLIAAVDGEEVKDKADEKYASFIETLTKGYKWYYCANAFLDKIAGIFDEIKNQIDEIYYYDTTTKQMVKRDEDNEKTTHIVLKSEDFMTSTGLGKSEKHGVADAEELINKYVVEQKIEYQVTDTSASKEVRDELHTVKGVNITIDQIEENVDNYQDLLDARAKINEYKNMANTVVKKIHEVYEQVVDGSKYYTYRDLIAKYEGNKLVGGVLLEYNALNDYDKDSEDGYTFDPEGKHYAAMDFAGAINYNDLQKLVDDAMLIDGIPEGKSCSDNTHNTKKAGNKQGGALFDMLKYLNDLDTKIKAVEDSLKDLAGAKEDAEYNEDYKSKIDAVRKAYDVATGNNKLDEDIISWDFDLYCDLNPDQAPENHEADDTKYGVNFPEYGEKPTEEGGNDTRRYIVDGYEDLLEAEAQWKEWEQEIDDLIDKLQKMVDKYENKNNEYDGEGHPMIRQEYTEITDAIHGLTGEQEKYFRDGKKLGSQEEKHITVDTSKFYLEDEEKGVLENGSNTPGDVMDEFDSIMNKIFDKADKIVEKIRELKENADREGCVFGFRKELVEIYQDYNALDEETQAYVYNYDDFKDLLAEYLHELWDVLGWKAHAKSLDYTKDPKTNVSITVKNWGEIAEAVEAFNKLLHEDEELIDGILGKLQTAVSKDENDFEHEIDPDNPKEPLTLKKVYEKYKDLADEYKKLVEAIEALDKQMKDLKTDDKLDIDGFADWYKEFEAAKEAFEALAKNEVTGEWMSDPANGHDKAYENYLKAKQLYDRYKVEELINNLYHENKFYETSEEHKDGYETNPEKLVEQKLVTLDKAGQIHQAREAFDAYLEEYGGEAPADVRNYSKLVAAEKALDMIVEELNNFMRRVVRLDLSNEAHKNLSEDATYDEIIDALYEILSGNYKGYPLDIYEDVKDGDTLPDMMKEYIGLVTVSETLSRDEADARIVYLLEARSVLLLMDKLGNKDKDNVDENVITHLNKLIEEIVEKLDAGTELSADDYNIVDEITSTYKKLHPSQQVEIEKVGLEKVEEAQDTKDAIESFKDMLEELYKNVVTNGEVTNYTQFYLDVLINIYDSFNPSVKDSLVIGVKGDNGEDKKLSFDEVVDAIKDAIQKAIEEDKVLSLHQMQETIEQAGVQSKEEMQQAIDALKQELAQAFMDAMLTDENSQVSLKEAIANFKNSIKDYVDGAIKAAIEKLTEEFQGKLQDVKDELNGNIEGMQEQLGKLQQAQEDLEAALRAAIEAGDNEILDALQAHKDELQGTINELSARLDAQKSALEDAKKDLADQIKKAQEAGDAALAAALQAQQTALEGKIAELTAQYEANKAALDAEIAALKESMLTEIEKGNDEVLKKLAEEKTDLEGQLNKVKEDLQGAIDAYKDKIAALEQFKTQTEAKLADAAKASDLTALRNDLLKAMTDLDSKYVTKTEFESKLAEFQQKLDAANGSLSSIQELRDQIAGVRDEMQKGDKQLQDQIDSMSSSITTLTALLIVIGVLLIAAIVCVVILFLKRNKN